MTIEVIEKSFNCSEAPSLTLSNIRGSVIIQAGPNGQISITATKKLDTGDADNTQIEILQTEDGLVKAATHYDKSGFRFFSNWQPCKVDYEVQVPEKCSLKLRGVSNSAVAEGISGRMDYSTVSGDLEFRRLSGEFKIKAVSGDVSGESLSGPLQLETVSGDIKFENCDFPSLEGKTVNGDMQIETVLRNGPYSFHAVSGDIKVISPGSGGVTIHTSSLSGDVRTNSQSMSSNPTRGNHKIDVSGGGIEIRHKSISGDFSLLNSQDNGAPLDSSQEKIAPQQPRSHSDILDRISSGELSADEALKLLEETPAA